MQRILIVEDDVLLSGGVKLFLETKGYEVDTAFSCQDAIKKLEQACNLVILDCNLPDGDGLSLCDRIRKSSDVPVIFLTAKDTEEDMICGFQHGCDDYIAKPFSVEVLNQRIMAVLRRQNTVGQSPSSVFTYKKLQADFLKMQISIDGVPVKLTATEYRLLECLIKHKGQVLTRSQILEIVWDCDENFVDENTLNVQIRRLRKKIEPDDKNPQYIITVFGIGYTFGE